MAVRLGSASAHNASLLHGVHVCRESDIADVAGHHALGGETDCIAQIGRVGIGDRAFGACHRAIETELLQHLPADFRNRYLQRDLVLALDRQKIDDLRLLPVFGEDIRVAVIALSRDIPGGRLTALEEGGGELFRLRRILRRADASGQHDVIGDDLHLDVRFRQEPAKVLLEPGNIALDCHVQADDLLPMGSEDEDVGLADSLAEKIDTTGSPRHRVSHAWVGDQNVVGVGRQIDNQGLVEAELQPFANARPPSVIRTTLFSAARA